MKIVVVPDSFKESMSSPVASEQIATGIRRVWPEAEITKLCMADGGEGTIEAIISSLQGAEISISTYDALGRRKNANIGWIEKQKTAVIEIAQAVGIEHIKPAERNILKSTSFGVGVMIEQALELGAKTIIVGLGGSATNDGGSGMLKALGAKFLDESGNKLNPMPASLKNIKTIDCKLLKSKFANVKVILACDVENPLIGKSGASMVFGPQKGATDQEVSLLESNLRHWGKVIETTSGIKVCNSKGAGAAGGLGAAFMGILNAKHEQGAKLIADVIRLENHICNADLVFTGEGAIDSQTLSGKTISWIASIAKKNSVPVIAIGGSLKSGYEKLLLEKDFVAILSTIRIPASLETILSTARKDLSDTVENACRLIDLGTKLQ